MFMAAAGSVAPKTRKGRTATVRPSKNFINSNVNTDSATILRLQRLRTIGVVGQRADLVANLVWEAHHG